MHTAKGSPSPVHSNRSSPDSYYSPLEVDFSKGSTIIPGRSKQSMAAIHTLPIEILTRIFLFGLPETEYPEFPPIGVPGFEVQVSHVCQHWRSIALAIPQLWSTVHLRTVPHIDRAKVYLRRSGTRTPLHIMVDTCDFEEHIPGYLLFRDEFLPIFSFLTPHIARWRSVQIKVRDRQCKLGARTVLSTCGPANNLEYLQLWHVETWETSERLFTQIGPPPVVVFNKSLPSLKHISLIGVNLPWVHSPFLEDLTSIEFGLHANDVRMPYNLWERMLASSPNLEKLSLHYSGPKGTAADWPNRAVRVPGMRELILEEMVPSTLIQLFPRLCIPHLATLHLNLPSLEDGEDCTVFLDYLVDPPPPLPILQDKEEEKTNGRNKRNGKDKEEARATHAGPIFRELQTLILDALECTAESFGRFLRASPTIKRLEMDGRKLGDGLLEEFLRVYDVTPKPAGDTAKKTESQRASEQPESAGTEDLSDETSREGSSDSTESGTGATADSASTAFTTPGPEPVMPAGAPAPSPTTEIVLPELCAVRVSGLSSANLLAFIQFRREHGRPVSHWQVSELMRCPELEKVAEEMEKTEGAEKWSWEYEEEEEEEGEDEDGEYEYEDEDGADGEVQEPRKVDDASPHPDATSAHTSAVATSEDAECEEDGECEEEE